MYNFSWSVCLKKKVCTPPKTNHREQKIDGWKMTFPFKTVPFLVTFVHFRGCLLFSKVLYTFYNSPMFCSLQETF